MLIVGALELNTSKPLSTYKPPKATVVLLGDVSGKVLERLSSILRVHGPKGIKLVIAHADLTKSVEVLRDLLFSNYAFTIELYFARPGELHSLVTGSPDVVSVLVSDPSLVNEVPAELRGVTEVV